MSLSFQLFSARNFTPWEKVLATLAEIGYTQVEGFGPNYENSAAFRALLDQHGMSMPSGHFSLESLENDLDTVFATAATLNIGTIIAPWLAPDERPTERAGWDALAARLDAVGQKVRAAGYRFAWHNHDFEFRANDDDGSIPMQVLLDTVPELEWEADIAWVVRGGADPLQWVERYGSRIPIAHAKDIAPTGECSNEDGWADFGHGVVDWEAIFPALQAAGTGLFVVEHDLPNDLNRLATRAKQSFNTLSATAE